MRADIPDFIRALDDADPLASLRNYFEMPAGIVYLDGNSLGALPRATGARLHDVIAKEWGGGLIRSWNSHDWVNAPARIGDKIAPLVGANKGEVVVADSTSVNIFKLAVAALKAQAPRSAILVEEANFPTDNYIAQGIAALLPGVTIRAAPAGKIVDGLDAEVALLLVPHVHYKSGAKYDMEKVTRRAHDVGALTLWDLSHSAGAVEIDLGRSRADLAVGCGYKYLNGGPGAPSFVYIATPLQEKLSSPITGWFGHRAPFAFADGYEPAGGIARFLGGTPPILGLAALEEGVELIRKAPLSSLFDKGQQLCSLFIALVETRLKGHGIEVVTPRDPKARGSHVSLRHPDGYPIVQALIAEDVIGDFRAPDIMRFGFTPLYLSFADVWRAVVILEEILVARKWDQPHFHKRGVVT